MSFDEEIYKKNRLVIGVAGESFAIVSGRLLEKQSQASHGSHGFRVHLVATISP